MEAHTGAVEAHTGTVKPYPEDVENLILNLVWPPLTHRIVFMWLCLIEHNKFKKKSRMLITSI